MIKQEINLISDQAKMLNDVLSIAEQNIWKILIFDSYNQQTISTLYKLKDLREHNITLYMNINQKRQQLHGVTAIYFIQPTKQNYDYILNDCSYQRYNSISIHFSSEPQSFSFSKFAKQIQQKYPKYLSRIQRIIHSFIGYHVVDKTMAILQSQSQITNFLTNFKQPPIILYQKNEENFVNSIKQKIINLQASNLFTDQSGYTLFLVLNRENDYSPILFHGVTYAGLMTDIYQLIGYNKVKIGKNQTFDFDIKDDIWFEKKYFEIGQFGIDKQIRKIKQKLNQASNTMDEYAELNQKHKKYEWHLNRANQLLKFGHQRQLNNYYGIQTELIAKKSLSKENKKIALDLLQLPNKLDKLRFLTLYLLHSDNIQNLQTYQKLIDNDLKENPFYKSIKEKRLRQFPAEKQGGSKKYLKLLAKGIFNNLIASNEKKFVVTNIIDQIQKNGINQIGFQIAEIKKCNLKLKNFIVYVKGGVNFNQYQNILQYNPDNNIIYTGDKFLHSQNLFKL